MMGAPTRKAASGLAPWASRAEKGAGGESGVIAGGNLRCLFPGISIPNAICFRTGRAKRLLYRHTNPPRHARGGLMPRGWPKGTPQCLAGPDRQTP